MLKTTKSSKISAPIDIKANNNKVVDDIGGLEPNLSKSKNIKKLFKAQSLK